MPTQRHLGARGVIRALLLAAALAGATPAARALDYATSPGGDALRASGSIVKGDLDKLKETLARLPRRPGTIYFDSGGGLLAEGIAIGNHLRAAGFATRVGEKMSCASACVFAFLGGVIREVDRGGRVGVHMASLMKVDGYIAELRKILQDQRMSLDDRIRVIVALNEQRAAQAANMEANHLIKMGVSLRMLEPLTKTLQVDIHWLTRQELHDFNVVNVAD